MFPEKQSVVVGVESWFPFLRDLGRHQQVGCWFYMQQWIALGLVFVFFEEGPSEQALVGRLSFGG